MPWVKFTADFRFAPPAMRGRSVVKYLAGSEHFLTREAAAEAVASGKGKLSRTSAPTLDDSAAARRDLGLPEQ